MGYNGRWFTTDSARTFERGGHRDVPDVGKRRDPGDATVGNLTGEPEGVPTKGRDHDLHAGRLSKLRMRMQTVPVEVDTSFAKECLEDGDVLLQVLKRSLKRESEHGIDYWFVTGAKAEPKPARRQVVYNHRPLGQSKGVAGERRDDGCSEFDSRCSPGGCGEYRERIGCDAPAGHPCDVNPSVFSGDNRIDESFRIGGKHVYANDQVFHFGLQSGWL